MNDARPHSASQTPAPPAAPPGTREDKRARHGEPGVNLKPSGRVHGGVRLEEFSGETAGTISVDHPVFSCRDVNVFYGSKHALKNVSIDVGRQQVLAMIGPSGCGKSTFLRCLNRMNDTVKGARVTGAIRLDGHDIHERRVDAVQLRARIGMVFQKPNPFPKSIYDNVAWAPRNLRLKAGLDERVERALRGAALWEEVKDRLHQSALGLSGGQQQRLCIARAIAIEPDVLLLDEPASAIDPIATAAIEELMQALKNRYTIVIVTHNMQQAARVADRTAFFSLEQRNGERTGTLVELNDTEEMFTRPRDRRTSDYVTGRFG